MILRMWNGTVEKVRQDACVLVAKPDWRGFLGEKRVCGGGGVICNQGKAGLVKRARGVGR